MNKKRVNRRNFVSSLGKMGVASLSPLPSFVFAAEKEWNGSPVLKTGPYLQSPEPTGMTVRWITHVPCVSWVEYGLAADRLTQKAQNVDHGLVEAYNTVHAIELKELRQGCTYFYRIVSKKIESFEPYKVTFGETIASDVYTFTTADPAKENVSFLVFNDIHDRPASFAHLMQYNGQEEHDFVFLNGDMFNFQSDEEQLVSHLLQPLAGLFSHTIPFYFSRGNHETRGVFARHLPAYFNSREQNFYFSFQYGPVYAIVLDSGEDKDDGTPVYASLTAFDRYRLEQAAWLKQEVQKKAFRQARFRVVFSHIPLYYAGDGHGTLHCRKVWAPVLNDAKIDVLISGHTHVYGVHPPKPGEHHYPIVIGGGPNEGKRTLIKVKADQHALRLTVIDDSGSIVGTLAC